jgi:hypothetical protein
MERALLTLLPKIVAEATFKVRTFRGKPDLLQRLPGVLKGYRHWPGAAEMGIVVVVDRDSDDCRALLDRLDHNAAACGFAPTSVSSRMTGQILNRLAIEELEAWFFGDAGAIAAAYPGVPATLGTRARFRDPDMIRNTWEALERVLQEAGHHQGGLRKIAAAQDIAHHLDVDANTSMSFKKFRDGVRLLVRGDA